MSSEMFGMRDENDWVYMCSREHSSEREEPDYQKEGLLLTGCLC
jgi:hypothetical protein